jgi:putative cardiolipin synthase
MRPSTRSRAVLVLLALVLGGCAQLPLRPDLQYEAAVPEGTGSPLDQWIAGREQAHSGQSAFRLLSGGPEAFITRVKSADAATRSIDVATYIWHGDTTGMHLAERLLAAADRGVKVRLLVDDMDARASNAGFAALAAHENISVRMFNPFASRSGKLSMMLEAMGSFSRINHRMHNKSWIVDNRLAVVGGRNLGDEYFGASEEFNFVDLDFGMIGPVVRDISRSFDDYWNSTASYPMQVLHPEGVTSEALAKFREYLVQHRNEESIERYRFTLAADEDSQHLISGQWPMQWSGQYTFAADNPLKSKLPENDPARTRVLTTLAPVLTGARDNVAVISPYFVPGKNGTAALVKLVAEGRQVRVLTNSLVANDVAAVHGGYERSRKPLLKGGVQIWELKPAGGTKSQSSVFGSSGASLHTKAFIVDSDMVFLGSYNLDPRSTWLNCEQGVLVENEALATQLRSIYATQINGEHAWKVSIASGKLSWTDGKESFDSDPKAGAWRKFQAWMARTLHLDAQL